MNTSGSKDLLRKPQKRISKRKNTGQGYFYNSHSCNLINRNCSLQTNSIGYSEHVFQNPNVKSYNSRLYPGRTNSGYLKHIHSQSIRREKEHSTMGYEEYTLRKIRTASDMIKQQLMSPEHSTISASETNIGSDDTNTNSLSKSKPHRFLTGSRILDSNEYSVTKLKRKPIKSSEEINRLQLKQKRKNELREKFKKDNASKLKTSENYTAKEISDLILKHISKLNNDRILDLLNSDDSRYGDAFNYICKQKSFEVTKALRDLSHQEKPEECEIVNSIIPDFSIKIEELPINIIKELSLTFDELHKNIGDSSFSDENLHLFNGENDLQTSTGLSVFLQQMCNDEVNEKNLDHSPMKVETQNDEICTNPDMIQSADKSESIIDVLDSDEEISTLKETENMSNTTFASLHLSKSIEKAVNSSETIATEYILSSNQSAILNSDIGCVHFTNIAPSEEIYGNTLGSNQSIFYDILPTVDSDFVSEEVIVDTISNINPLQNNGSDTDEIVKNVESNFFTIPESIKIEQDSQEDSNVLIPPGMTINNSQPKVGSVWVSKNIFEKSDGSNIENSIEVYHELLNDLSPCEQNLEIMSVTIENSPNILKTTTENLETNSLPVQISPRIMEEEATPVTRHIEQICPDVSGPWSCTLQHSSPEDDNLMQNSLISPSTINDNLQLVTEIDKENFSKKDTNNVEICTKDVHTPICELRESSNISISNRNLKDLPEFDTPDHTITNSTKMIPSSVSVDKFVSATIKTFDKPKNLKVAITPTGVNTDKFVTLTIKKFDKPKNLKDAINFMTEIDKHIEVLTKLRQDIFIGLSENATETETVAPKHKKQQLEETTKSDAKKSSRNNMPKSELEKDISIGLRENIIETETVVPNSKKRKLEEAVTSQENADKSSVQKLPIEKETIKPSNPKPFQSLNNVCGVVIICKILYEKNELIVGTADGNIQYHSIHGNKPLMTVDIGNSAISFLESVRINERYFICTGNCTELEIKILKYKKKFIEHRVYLEDSIQVVKNDWGYFFIGGKRGYLTRYDWRKDKIQFEDRISPSCIKDLKTTREGPRKILVILIEDAEGEAHIHVRDAMTALHIRTIIDMKNVRCMFVRYSSVYLVTDEQISVYNYCDGNFIRKVTTLQNFCALKSRGDFMILNTTNGVYAFNMKTNKYIGCLKSGVSPSTLFIYEKSIICCTSSMKMESIDIPDHCKDIITWK